MKVENENFFDFFGLIEEELRSLYAKSGKLLYTPEIHFPAPTTVVPEMGLNAIGTKIITIDQKSKVDWVDIVFWLALFILVAFIVWRLAEWYYQDVDDDKVISESSES